VTHRTTPRFWAEYHRLPVDVRQLADANFELLKANARHPSLMLKRVGEFWSVRVGIHHRAVAREDAGDLVWFWIGTHAEYDHLIGRKR